MQIDRVGDLRGQVQGRRRYNVSLYAVRYRAEGGTMSRILKSSRVRRVVE
jgi:hypothetical protein